MAYFGTRQSPQKIQSAPMQEDGPGEIVVQGSDIQATSHVGIKAPPNVQGAIKLDRVKSENQSFKIQPKLVNNKPRRQVTRANSGLNDS